MSGERPYHHVTGSHVSWMGSTQTYVNLHSFSVSRLMVLVSWGLHTVPARHESSGAPDTPSRNLWGSGLNCDSLEDYEAPQIHNEDGTFFILIGTITNSWHTEHPTGACSTFMTCNGRVEAGTKCIIVSLLHARLALFFHDFLKPLILFYSREKGKSQLFCQQKCLNVQTINNFQKFATLIWKPL